MYKLKEKKYSKPSEKSNDFVIGILWFLLNLLLVSALFYISWFVVKNGIVESDEGEDFVMLIGLLGVGLFGISGILTVVATWKREYILTGCMFGGPFMAIIALFIISSIINVLSKL